MAAEPAKSEGEKSHYSGVERAAIMMLSLPDEQSQKIFSYLDPDEIRDLSQAMVNLGTVKSNAIEEVCVEFVSEMASSGSLVGSIESTKRLLLKIMSKEDVDRILEEIRGPSGRNVWDKLGGVDEEVLAGYLKNESPQIVAVVLSRIRSGTAAKVLSYLPETIADEVVMRVLRMDKVKKDILEDVETTLHREFISTLGRSLTKDPYEVVAEIFNNLDRSSELRLMNGLEQKNSEAAEKVRHLMFTFEDVGELNKASIQVILRTITRSKLAMALKGTQDSIKQKFTENMSIRGAKLLMDEMSALGPVRLKDVEIAQNEIVVAAKEMAARGEIDIRNSVESNEEFVE